MGVFEGELGESLLGIEYFLALISMACLITRTPFVLLAVGVSPLRRRSLRWFAGLACRAATYRTYRDVYSRRAAVGMRIGAEDDGVFSDIVFAFDQPAHGDRSVESRVSALNVGLGVMSFYGRHPSRSPEVNRTAHERYVSAMAILARRLILHGHQVDVYIGDEADLAVADELTRRVASHVPDGSRIAVVHAAEFISLVHAMASADVVVASRYHNLIAGVIASRPVVALAYAEKSSDLMRRYDETVAVDLDALDADTVFEAVDDFLHLDPGAARSRRAAGRASMQGAAHAQLVRLTTLLDEVAAVPRLRRRSVGRGSGL